jgi:RNA-directed DNA polymerase
VISPLLSNLYLNEVDEMLERAKAVTRRGRYTYIEYARFADDLVILVDGYRKWDWLTEAAYRRLLEELAKLDVQLNRDKTRRLDLTKGESFGFLGFDFRRVKTRRGVWGVRYAPRMKARTALLQKLKEVFRRFRSQPVDRVIALINPVLRGWVNYFRVGHSSRCFGCVKDWVEKKIRRHLMRARQRQGFGWKRWSRRWLYRQLGLFSHYRVAPRAPKALPVRYRLVCAFERQADAERFYRALGVRMESFGFGSRGGEDEPAQVLASGLAERRHLRIPGTRVWLGARSLGQTGDQTPHLPHEVPGRPGELPGRVSSALQDAQGPVLRGPQREAARVPELLWYPRQPREHR